MPKIPYSVFILIGLFLTYAASNGLMLTTLPLLYPSLMDEFGWDPAQVTRPAALSYFLSAFLSIGAGYVVDRFSPRKLMIVGAIIYTGALFGYSYVSSLTQLFIIYGLLSLAITLCGLLPSMVITSRWFKKNRGLAVGILLMASSLGGAVLPLIVGPILDTDGWRTALVTLTIIGGVMMVVPTIFVIRDWPRDRGGLTQEAVDAPLSVAKHHDQNFASQMTTFGILRELLQSPKFYLLAFSTGAMWFCISGAIQHQSIYLGKDLGMGGQQLATTFSVFFFSSVIGKLLFGWISDFFRKIDIMLLATLNLVLGLLIFRFLDSENIASVYAYAVIYGIGFAGVFTMIQLTIAEFYAGPAYGRILGLFIFIDTLAGGLGIAIVGQLRASFESYYPAINLMIGLGLAASCCVFLIRLMQTRPKPAS